MMKRFAGLIAAVALPLLSACAVGDLDMPPEVSLTDLRPIDAGLFEQKVALTLRIRNPNPAPLPIDGYRFALELNGQAFARGFSDERITVGRLSDATTEASAVVSTLDVMRQLIAVPGRKGLEYRLTGTAFLAGSVRQVPFEQAGRLDFQELAPITR
ncbi:MAG: LEA type 2 family protein [Solirubrobacterales bacterium]